MGITMSYQFEDFEFDTATQELWRSGELVKIEPQVYALLHLLIANPDRVVSKDEINEIVWDGRFVSEAVLNSRIRTARLAVDDDGKTQRLIKTSHGRGYRFVGDVKKVEGSETDTEVETGVESQSRDSSSVISFNPIDMPSVQGNVQVQAGSARTSTNHKKYYALAAGFLAIAAIFITIQFIKPNEAPSGNNIQQAQMSSSPSIAVLPFADMSASGDSQYLGDGIAEELLNVLAPIKNLKVTSRTSAFAMRNTELSIPEIGEALQVNHVLEGSIRQSGDKIRVTAQLIDTQSDKHIWSKTFDRDLTAENIFQIQDDLATMIVAELSAELELTDTELPHPSKPMNYIYALRL